MSCTYKIKIKILFPHEVTLYEWLLLFTEHSDTCCQSVKERDSGVSRLILRSKTLNEPVNRYSLRGTSEL